MQSILQPVQGWLSCKGKENRCGIFMAFDSGRNLNAYNLLPEWILFIIIEFYLTIQVDAHRRKPQDEPVLRS